MTAIRNNDKNYNADMNEDDNQILDSIALTVLHYLFVVTKAP
jgi:hypothetical protein